MEVADNVQWAPLERDAHAVEAAVADYWKRKGAHLKALRQSAASLSTGGKITWAFFICLSNPSLVNSAAQQKAWLGPRCGTKINCYRISPLVLKRACLPWPQCLIVAAGYSIGVCRTYQTELYSLSYFVAILRPEIGPATE